VSGQTIVEPTHVFSAVQAMSRAKPGGHTMDFPLQVPTAVQSIRHKPVAQPPVHAAGHAPPGGMGRTPHAEASRPDLLPLDPPEIVGRAAAARGDQPERGDNGRSMA
jgi:hypothetical protein